MKKNATLILCLLLLATSSATAKVTPELYPYAKQLELSSDASADARFGACDIDEELYSALNKEATNLRLVDSKGTEIPFLIRTKTGDRTVEQITRIPYRKLTFNKPEENSIEIELQRDPAQRYMNRKISSVVLSSGLKNFEKHVSVYCGDNGKQWRLLAENKAIFDYSRFIDIRNNRIAFPATDAKFFKLRISNISEKHQSPYTRLSRTMQAGIESSATKSTSFTRTDFKIDEITFYERTTRTVKGKTLRQSYSSTDFAIREEDKQSLISFATANTPISRITLLTSDAYFHRTFVLENSDNGETWKRLNSGTISRLGEETDARANRTIILPRTTRSPHWRITISNNDSPPLNISGVELEGETREIVFYRDKAENYRIIYGSENSVHPVYDIVRVLPQAEKQGIAAFRTEAQQNNPDYDTEARTPFFISRRIIMIVSVLIMIVVLVWVIAETVKKIEP